MNLQELRQEVLDHGFDPNAFSTRINRYLNDAQNLVARRVNYYLSEAQYAFSTVAGTALYVPPGNWARLRSLVDTDRDRALQEVSLSWIDNSPDSSGRPYCYTLDGSQFTAELRLYPTPDGVYPLALRYWERPAELVADTDVPQIIPTDWHHMLWVYATWMCYEAEDDPQMGQYWQGRFASELSMFSADQKFPNTDTVDQIDSMWGEGGW